MIQRLPSTSPGNSNRKNRRILKNSGWRENQDSPRSCSERLLAGYIDDIFLSSSFAIEKYSQVCARVALRALTFRHRAWRRTLSHARWYVLRCLILYLVLRYEWIIRGRGSMKWLRFTTKPTHSYAWRIRSHSPLEIWKENVISRSQRTVCAQLKVPALR